LTIDQRIRELAEFTPLAVKNLLRLVATFVSSFLIRLWIWLDREMQAAIAGSIVLL
jgi:hypothetical protein